MLLPTLFFLSFVPVPSVLAQAPDAASAQPRRAQGDEVRRLVGRVQSFYERTADFTAHFEQEYAYASFGKKQRSSGEVVFKKPGMMRWDYEKPASKTFVLAGERVLALDPAALTLTKAQIGSDQLSSAVTFLFGRGKLLEEFRIQLAECSTCRGDLLELVPRKTERFQKLLLEVDANTGQVLASTVVDPDGSHNRIAFSELRTNVGVEDARFRLKPPPGTQLVDLTGSKP